MAKIHVRLEIIGNVQSPPYKIYVKLIARNLGVKGIIRDLEDGMVEAFCELEENTISNFLKLLEKHAKPNDYSSINVEEIKVYKEGDANYINPPEKFEPFEIDYRIELSPFEKRVLEKIELMLLNLEELVRGSKTLRHGVEEAHKFVKEIGSETGKIRANLKGLIETLRELSADVRRIKETVKERRKGDYNSSIH